MGEMADMMLDGTLCAMCGQPMECKECFKMGIPMYCSEQCAKDAGENPENRFCNH